MKEYLKNLLTAVCGKNPYRLEVEKLREEMEKAAVNVRALHDSYYREAEKASMAEDLCKKAESVMEEYKETIARMRIQQTSLQNLVENYREHLKEKDEMIDGIRKDYQRQVANYEKRVGDYCATIAELQKKAAPREPKARKRTRTKKTEEA